MMAEYKVNKKDVDFTKADVEDWVGSLEIEQVTAIVNEYIKLTTADKPGEPLTQA